MMLYQWHELSRNLMAPWIHQAEANAKLFSDPNSWLSTLPGADRIAAGNELVHRLGKDYEKPPWNIHQVEVERRQGAGGGAGNHFHAVLPPAALQALHR